MCFGDVSGRVFLSRSGAGRRRHEKTALWSARLRDSIQSPSGIRHGCTIQFKARPEFGAAALLPSESPSGIRRSWAPFSGIRRPPSLPVPFNQKTAPGFGAVFGVELPGFEPGIILLIINVLCGVSYSGPTIRPFVSKYDVP